jgi:hypothetical protein
MGVCVWFCMASCSFIAIPPSDGMDIPCRLFSNPNNKSSHTPSERRISERLYQQKQQVAYRLCRMATFGCLRLLRSNLVGNPMLRIGHKAFL